MIRQSLKVIYVTLGVACLLLGVAGIFLPLLPTTPFALLAAFLFSKSSQRLHDWLLAQPLLGPMILEWRAYRVIRPRAKLAAALAIVLCCGTTIAFASAPTFAKVSVALIGVSVLVFILTRRSALPRPE